jgi:hypothetical protein
LATVEVREEVVSVLDQVPQLEDSPAGWLLVFHDGPEALKRVHETLLVVADGAPGTRGSLEEDGS